MEETLALSNDLDDLVVVQGDEGRSFEVLDPIADTWLLKLEALYDAGEVAPGSASPAALLMLSRLVEHAPELEKALREATTYRVVFSPRVMMGLKTGQYVFVRAGRTSVAVARSAKTGHIAQHGRLVGGSAGSAGSKAALLGAAAITWPVLLVTAAAVASTLAQQAWLEQTLGRLEEALGRIEDRLRDDDHGVLEASEHLAGWIEPYLSDGGIPEQFRMELASSRQQVEAVYYARRRFVERFKRQLEEGQVQHQRKKGDVDPWAAAAAEELTKRGSGVLDELLIFLRSLVCRARLTTATAAVLSANGEPHAAFRLMEHLDEELRRDYHDLHNRIRALARSTPDAPVWQRVPMLSSTNLPKVSGASKQRAFAVVRQIEQLMHETVGSSLPPRESAVELLLDAGMMEGVTVEAGS